MDTKKTLVAVGAFAFTAMFSVPDKIADNSTALHVADVARTPIGDGQEVVAAKLSDSSGQVHVVLGGWGKLQAVARSGRDRCVIIDGWKVSLPAGGNMIAVYAGHQEARAVGTAKDFRAVLKALDGHRLLESAVWKMVIAPELPGYGATPLPPFIDDVSDLA